MSDRQIQLTGPAPAWRWTGPLAFAKGQPSFRPPAACSRPAGVLAFGFLT